MGPPWRWHPTMDLHEKQRRGCEAKGDTMNFNRYRRSLAGRMISPLRLTVAAAAILLAATPAKAQISFTTAVDLALKNSPRVMAAEAEVAKAQAALEESKDVYIPTLVGGSGLG